MTPAERIAAVEARRAAARAEVAAAHAEQQATDLEALADLEETHGYERILRIDINGWAVGQGAATLVVTRVPKASEKVFKRFQETVEASKKGATASSAAAETLARSCLVYPSPESAKALYDATIDLAPGILGHVALQIVEAVQGRAEEEKKG